MVLFLKIHCSRVLGPRLWIPGTLRMIVGKLTLDIYVICVIQLDSPNLTFRVMLAVITCAVCLLCLSTHSGTLSPSKFFSLPKAVISGSPWDVSVWSWSRPDSGHVTSSGPDAFANTLCWIALTPRITVSPVQHWGSICTSLPLLPGPWYSASAKALEVFRG